MGKIDVFTDGACIGNGTKTAYGGWAVYFESDITEINSKRYSKKFKGVATNQRCEIYAIYMAEKLLNKYIKKHSLENQLEITIYTDSKFVMDCLNSWIRGWVKNGWATKNKKPVKNPELLKSLWSEHVKLKRASKLKLVHVRSHQKRPEDKEAFRLWHGNDLVDKLAGESMRNH